VGARRIDISFSSGKTRNSQTDIFLKYLSLLKHFSKNKLISEKVTQQCDKVLTDIDAKIKSETNVLNDID